MVRLIALMSKKKLTMIISSHWIPRIIIKLFEWNTSRNNQHSRPFPSSFGVHELILETPLAKHLSQANRLNDSHNQFSLLYYYIFLIEIEWGWTWTWIFIRKMDIK